MPFLIPFIPTTDIPECTTGDHNCTGNAICIEAIGYFRCVCPANFRIDDETYASCKGIPLISACATCTCCSLKLSPTYMMYMTYNETNKQPHPLYILLKLLLWCINSQIYRNFLHYTHAQGGLVYKLYSLNKCTFLQLCDIITIKKTCLTIIV